MYETEMIDTKLIAKKMPLVFNVGGFIGFPGGTSHQMTMKSVSVLIL